MYLFSSVRSNIILNSPSVFLGTGKISEKKEQSDGETVIKAFWDLNDFTFCWQINNLDSDIFLGVNSF